MRAASARRGALITFASFVLLLGLFAAQLWVHATRTSATSDEPVHILAGYRYWECGDFALNPEHPPLLKLLATAPLRARHLIGPDWPCGTRTASKVEVAYAGAQFVSRNGMDAILLPTRIVVGLVSLLLALLVFLLAWEMFGRNAALVALTLFVFEPTVIAHGSLVTTDMALTAATFLTVYALYRYGSRPSVLRLLVVGLAMGVMLAVKHSGILMLPALSVLMFADLGLRRRRDSGTGGCSGVLRVALAYVAVLLVALVVLWGAYGFRYYALPGATHASLSIADLFPASRPEVARPLSRTLAEWVQQTHIFPEAYTFGLADIIAGGTRPMYLLGAVYPTGRWFYFPAAFAIKSSIALLLLLPFGLFGRELYRTHRRQMLYLLVPSLAYFAVSLTSGLNIGIRHLLPVYPFFVVVAAAAACRWSRRSRACLYGLVVLLLFHAWTAVRTMPNYLAFANDLWGGTRNSYRLLNDSNGDWGQTLKIVEAYVERNGIHDCWLATPGMAELVRPYRTCRKLPAYNWAATPDLVELVPPVIEGTVLISAWELPPWGGQEYAPIAATAPVDVLGGSVLVFRGRFEVPLAAALSYVGRADQLLGWGRYAESLQDARRGVELGPSDPRTHWELAAAYARNGMPADAQREVGTARRLAPAGPAYFASKLGG